MSSTEIKTCSMCKEAKPMEAFGRNRKGDRVIVRSACKACTNRKKKEQRDANPEKVKEILRRSYQKHREKRLDYARRKRQDAPEIQQVASTTETHVGGAES